MLRRVVHRHLFVPLGQGEQERIVSIVYLLSLLAPISSTEPSVGEADRAAVQGIPVRSRTHRVSSNESGVTR